MHDAISAKIVRVEELIATIRAAEAELGALLGGAATPPLERKRKPKAASKKPVKVTSRKKNACGLCGKAGHSRRTCGSEVKPTFEPKNESPLPDGYEEDIAQAIREEWGEAHRPPLEVCNELAIPLEEFNRIVEKHKIVQV